jgi:hypothetical protein
MLSRALGPRARAATTLATSRVPRAALATKAAGGGSPFAQSPEPEASGAGRLSRYEELKQRQDDMARMMREKTMLEVHNAAKVRPSPTVGPHIEAARPSRTRAAGGRGGGSRPRPEPRQTLARQGRRAEGVHHVLGKAAAACSERHDAPAGGGPRAEGPEPASATRAPRESQSHSTRHRCFSCRGLWFGLGLG